MISYEPFWKTLKDKNVSQYSLIKKYGVSTGTITNLKNSKPIETTTIEKFCKILDCRVEDIIVYIPDDVI